jgi:hypothetical protein
MLPSLILTLPRPRIEYASDMTRIAGRVKDGVVIPDEPLKLPDDTPVTVEISSRDWLLTFAGIWRDDPGIEAFLREWPESRTSSPGRQL